MATFSVPLKVINSFCLGPCYLLNVFHFSQGVSLSSSYHLVLGSIVFQSHLPFVLACLKPTSPMTKAVVRKRFLKQPAQRHFRGRWKNLCDLHDLPYPFGLMAGARDTQRKGLFAPSHLFNMFSSKGVCVRMCTRSIFT